MGEPHGDPIGVRTAEVDSWVLCDIYYRSTDKIFEKDSFFDVLKLQSVS
jgi:hypothetical protein